MPTSRTKAQKDANRVSTLTGVSSKTTTIAGVSFVTGVTPVPIAVNPSTHKVKITNP